VVGKIFFGQTAVGLLIFSFAFLWAASTAIYATANISGGHLNPAITFAMILASRMSIIKGLCYIACQILGGILGSVFVYGAIPTPLGDAALYGVTTLSSHVGTTAGDITFTVSVGTGFFMEFLVTLFLIWVVFATVSAPGDEAHLGRMAPMAIGQAIFLGNLIAGPITGGSMNPARSFGPAVIANYWDNHWIYWIAPLLGSIAGLTLYKILEEPDYKPEYKEYKPFV